MDHGVFVRNVGRIILLGTTTTVEEFFAVDAGIVVNIFVVRVMMVYSTVVVDVATDVEKS